jgi:uncharacterized membrane protein
MRRTLLAYAFTAATFLALDAVWLSQAGPRIYLPDLAPLLSKTPNLGAAALFYALYLAAVVWLCVRPALGEGSWRRAAVNGAVLGLAAYSAYDLTNQATLRIWSWRITVFDLGWGVLATAAAAASGYALTGLASKRGQIRGVSHGRP